MKMTRSLLAISLLTVSVPVLGNDGIIRADEKIGGATLRIEVRPPVDRKKADELIAWVRSTALVVSQTYGRFPNPSPRIIITPTTARFWGGDSAVTFGRVTRSGGETIELFVNPDRPIDEFYDDWTAAHEFSHLMLPLLSKRHRWISEGFATYYQNVLMSRSGRYTPEYAWQQLRDGFDRGRASRPELSPNDAAAAGIRQARMKVYWSGAAIALMADIELRRRSDGRESLDSVLGQLQHCCLPARRSWSGRRLFRKLDSFIDEPVFMPLYRQYANRDGFPEVESVLNELGVRSKSDGVVLDNDSALADIRRAID